jgi:uncharacterized membrane protein YeaQ/YmgE (transglycosylase-associated protein family)
VKGPLEGQGTSAIQVGLVLADNCQQSRRNLMGILTWILFGLVVGVIAKLLMPGRDPGGFIVTILLGIAGALFGGFIGRAMGFYGENQGAGWIMSILGAILLLAIYRMMVRKRV